MRQVLTGVSSQTRELLTRANWLSPKGITCSISNWVAQLLPKELRVNPRTILSVPQYLRFIACHGATRTDACKIGQVSFLVADSKAYVLYLKEAKEAQLLQGVLTSLYMSKPASALRTAIMLGLELPYIEEGVISCTRTEPFTQDELYALYLKGRKVIYEQ